MDSKTDVRILIVEDNLSFALDLEIMLNELGFSSFKTVDNSAEALESIYSEDIDLILMDIDIKGNLSGTQIGEKIKHLDIPIIFLTGFDDEMHYRAATASNIAGYLIKPTNKFTLESTINNALKKYNNTSETLVDSNTTQGKENVFDEAIFIKRNKTYHKLLIKNISYIEANGNYTLVYQSADKFISNINFTKLKSLLKSDFFIQIHRSYVINLNFFSSINIEENAITMQGGAVLPISKSNKKKLLDKMKLG